METWITFTTTKHNFPAYLDERENEKAYKSQMTARGFDYHSKNLLKSGWGVDITVNKIEVK